jgi:hypothetical protein
VGGHGVSRLLEAVAVRGGRIERSLCCCPPPPRWRRWGGGSLGREGPMIGLGAMVSSWLGDRLKLPAHRIKVLVGCGAAAGMAAIFNTPIGGALFAMEVILGNCARHLRADRHRFGAVDLRGAVPRRSADLCRARLRAGERLGIARLLGAGDRRRAGVAAFVHVAAGGERFRQAAWLPIWARPVVA